MEDYRKPQVPVVCMVPTHRDTFISTIATTGIDPYYVRLQPSLPYVVAKRGAWETSTVEFHWVVFVQLSHCEQPGEHREESSLKG